MTIAKSILLSSREEELGCKLLKGGTGTTNVFAGDGTTSSVILTRELVKEGIKAIEYGMHPIDLKIGMQAAGDAMSAELSKIAKKIYPCKSDLFKVAMVSTNYDNKLAEVVAEGLTALGKDGSFTLEESKTTNTYVEIAHGVTMERGFVSEEFINIPLIRMCEFENPYVMVVGGKITKTSEIVPVLELVKKTGRPLLLFSTDLQKDPLGSMIYHSKKGMVKSCAVNVPWQAGEEIKMLHDLCALTGATFIDNSMMRSIKNITLASLGRCSQAKISNIQTQLLGCQGSPAEIAARIQSLKNALSDEAKQGSQHRRKILQDRLSRMTGMVGIIYVGGETDVVKNETHDKLVDALNACKGAIERGVLPGGGASLVHAAKKLPHVLKLANIDQKRGAQIVQNAAPIVMRAILQNAGANDKKILYELQEMKNDWIGYNVKDGMVVLRGFCLENMSKNAAHQIGKMMNMWDAGVWDSLKVVQTYIKDAISIAGLVMSTECIAVRRKGYKRMTFFEVV